MESLYLIKCHKILDPHKVEEAVVIVDYILIDMVSVVCIELKALKILTFAINGDKDILKDERRIVIQN